MGDIADMMLDGTLCQGCGVVFDDVEDAGGGPGHPRTCNACEHGEEHPDPFGDAGDAMERLLPRTSATLKSLQAEIEAPPHGVVDLFDALKGALSSKPKRRRRKRGRRG